MSYGPGRIPPLKWSGNSRGERDKMETKTWTTDDQNKVANLIEQASHNVQHFLREALSYREYAAGQNGLRMVGFLGCTVAVFGVLMGDDEYEEEYRYTAVSFNLLLACNGLLPDYASRYSKCYDVSVRWSAIQKELEVIKFAEFCTRSGNGANLRDTFMKLEALKDELDQEGMRYVRMSDGFERGRGRDRGGGFDRDRDRGDRGRSPGRGGGGPKRYTSSA